MSPDEAPAEREPTKIDPERFVRLREILLTLPSLPTAMRGEYLDRACAGDALLRRQVETLLEVDPDAALPALARTGGIPHALELPTALDLSAPAADLPERIGPYRVLGILGHGGMGVVYRAEQKEPIAREVAIKVVRSGLDRRSVLARFRAEQRALALMEHPGIARVLDAGEDAEQRPYFVMELVRGVPITDFCRAGDIPNRERLRLFRDVCHAVQHAHQKGIIHRDLKPSNILITTQSGEPAARVIDFGIAKALESDVLGASDTLTREGQLVGTIEYMSPEQAGGRAAEADTRSDVYALGVILYEVLTGELPYDIRGKPLIDAARAIVEQSPRPLRQTAGATTRIDPDLETIVFKALEKEPERRYASAAALAEDIDRYLQGHAVLAHPPSTVYQIRKMFARNKVPVALGLALIVFLAVFGITMSVLFDGQRRERTRAEAEAAKAREVNAFLRGMLTSVQSEGSSVTVHDVLDAASRDIGAKFTDAPDVKAAIHSAIGTAFAALSEPDAAKQHLDASLELRRAHFGERHPEVAASLSELADYQQTLSWSRERQQRADSLARAAYEMRRELLPEGDPDMIASLVQLARFQSELGNKMEADSLYTEALAHTRRRDPDDLSIARILRERGDPLFNTGRQAEAEKSLREALAIYNRVYPGDHPDKSMCMFDLTDVLTDDAEIESLAIAHIDMERRLWGGKHPFMIESLGKLGYFYALRHRWAEAESLLRESLAIGEQLDEPDHISLGTACNDLASLLHGMERYKETLVLYRRAYDIWSRKLHPADPHVLMSRSNLATTLEKMGFDDEAWRLLEEGLAAAEADSATPYVAMYHKRMLEFLSAQKRHAEADEHARAALAYYRGNAHWIHAWAGCLKLQGHMLRSLGRLEEGELCHAEADSILRTDGRIATPGIENLRGWGRCLHEMGRLDDAYRRLKEAHDRFAEDYGKDHWFYSIHAVGLSEVEADRGEWAAAVEHANAGRSRLLALPNADSEDDPLSPAQRDHRSEFLERANRVLDRARAAGVEIPPEA